jgi:hypothetical protein
VSLVPAPDLPDLEQLYHEDKLNNMALLLNRANYRKGGYGYAMAMAMVRLRLWLRLWLWLWKRDES